MEPYYVGLGVRCRQSAFRFEDGEGRAIFEGEVPTTREAVERLRAVHHLPSVTPVVKRGTVALFVARQLAAVGRRLMMVDAHEVRH
jgi:hypothetical protein